MLSVRPKVAELVFQLYGRALHPELFQVHSTRTIKRGDYEATIQITNSGHLVTWHYQGQTLTEVATEFTNPMPERRRLMNHKLKGEGRDRMVCRGGVVYQMNYQLEPVTPEVFWSYQEGLNNEAEREGMLHRFATGRLALGALSYIHVETRNRSLMVQAFHTFPDDYAIVKSQSMFEIGG